MDENRTRKDAGSGGELAAATAWAAEHRSFLELVFREFETTGEWPDSRALHRHALRSDPEANLLKTARAMPWQLGAMLDRGNQNYQVVLTARGIGFCPGSESLTSAFVEVVRLAWKLYVEDDSPQPAISNEIVRQRLALGETRTTRVEKILLRELFLFAGLTQNGDGTWEGKISDDIQEFRGVEHIDDYLAIQARLMMPQVRSAAVTPPVFIARGRVAVEAPPSEQEQILALGQLDPLVANACRDAFDADHYAFGIQRAVIALRDLVRDRSGLADLDGDALFGKAFGGSPPRLAVADLATATGASVQRGTRLLAQGIIARFRNPLAHESLDVDSVEAMEMAATISLVARRVARAIRLDEVALVGDRSEHPGN